MEDAPAGFEARNGSCGRPLDRAPIGDVRCATRRGFGRRAGRARRCPAHGVQGEPARDRRCPAAPELEAAVRGTRRGAVRVRAAGRAERERAPCRPRPRVDVGPRRVRRVDAAPVRRSRPALGRAALLAGSRVGRKRPGLRLERAGMVGDGPHPALRLGGELDRARARGRRDEDGPGPDAAARVQALGHARSRARLRDEPRPLRAAPERPARGRPALHSRLDQLQQAPPVPGVRRHGAPEAGRQRRGRARRQRLVPRGPDGLRRPAQRLRRPARAARADRSDLRGRAPRDRGQRRQLEVRDRPDPDVGDLPRRDLRRAPREAGLEPARLRRSRLDGRQARESPPRTP